MQHARQTFEASENTRGRKHIKKKNWTGILYTRRGCKESSVDLHFFILTIRFLREFFSCDKKGKGSSLKVLLDIFSSA